MKTICSTIAAGLLLTCCATAPAQDSRRDIARASFALAERAQYFHRLAFWRTGFGPLAPAAQRFALAATVLHRNVQRGANYEQVLLNLVVLQQSHEALRQGFTQIQAIYRDLPMFHEWNQLDRTMGALELTIANGSLL